MTSLMNRFLLSGVGQGLDIILTFNGIAKGLRENNQFWGIYTIILQALLLVFLFFSIHIGIRLAKEKNRQIIAEYLNVLGYVVVIVSFLPVVTNSIALGLA